MKNKRTLFYIWVVIPIFIAIVIFIFSGHNGNTSENISESFTRNLFPSIISDDVISFMERIIRKVAHYGIYFALGISVMMLYRSYFAVFKGRHIGIAEQIFVPGTVCFVYSLTDELHQIFVPGRNGSFLDCLLDTAGALSGIIFMLVVLRVIKKISKK